MCDLKKNVLEIEYLWKYVKKAQLLTKYLIYFLDTLLA